MQYRRKSLMLGFVVAVFALGACTDVQGPPERDLQVSFSKDKEKNKDKVNDDGGVSTMAEEACVDVGGTGDFYCEPYPCASMGGSWQVDENGNVVCRSSGTGGTGGGGSGGTGGGGGGGSGGGGGGEIINPPTTTEPYDEEPYAGDGIGGYCDALEPTATPSTTTSSGCGPDGYLDYFVIAGPVLVNCPATVVAGTSGPAVTSANSTGVTAVNFTRSAPPRWRFKKGAWFKYAHYTGTAVRASDGSTRQVQGDVWCKVGFGIFRPAVTVE